MAGTTATTTSIVYVVDDDLDVRELLRVLVRSVGLSAKVYATAEDFLEGYSATPDVPACLVLDALMPGMSGFDLLEKLCEKGVAIPTIMTSAYADVPMAVQAMSSGILDFMEKPFSRQALLARIREAIDRDACRLREKARRAEVAARLATLSPREHEVMDWLVAGKHTKQIAHDLGISAQTVARHRLRVLSKMQVESVAELIHLVLTFTLTRT